MGEMMKISMKSKDLAQMLGVSPSTISMVLNNKPGISESTRKLILNKIHELGIESSDFPTKSSISEFIYFMIYLKHGKVVGDTPFFSQLIEGIEQSAKSYRYNLLIVYFNEGDDISTALPLIHSGQCKGLILLATEMSIENIEPFTALGKPIVLLDSYFKRLSLDTIIIDNTQTASSATRYLIEKGHRQIGYLHSAFHINNFSERKDGFYKELEHFGLQIHPDSEYKLTPTVDEAYKEMKEILASNPSLPTAFFADNDIIALSAMRALKESGYKIPEDISIIGIDNMPTCELMDPPLTTMHVPKQQMGILAMRRLVEKINGQLPEPFTIKVCTTLVERYSIKQL